MQMQTVKPMQYYHVKLYDFKAITNMAFVQNAYAAHIPAIETLICSGFLHNTTVKSKT